MSAYEEELISEHQNEKLKENLAAKDQSDDVKLPDERQFSFKEGSSNEDEGERRHMEEQKHNQDSRHVIALMNDPGDEGEDQGEEREEEHHKGAVSQASSEDNFQFKSSESPEEHIQEVEMWNNLNLPNAQQNPNQLDRDTNPEESKEMNIHENEHPDHHQSDIQEAHNV